MYVQLNKFPYFSVALYGPDICAKWFFPSPRIAKVIAIMSQNLLYGSIPSSGN